MNNATYSAHPERLVANRALDSEVAVREMIEELRAKLLARKALVAAAGEARDMLAVLPSMDKPTADQEISRIHDLLDAALKVYEG